MQKLVVRAEITEPDNIGEFICCSKCAEELPEGMVPQEWTLLDIGLTPNGIQVWCRRHEVNVAHFILATDEEVEQHRAQLEAQQQETLEELFKRLVEKEAARWN